MAAFRRARRWESVITLASGWVKLMSRSSFFPFLFSFFPFSYFHLLVSVSVDILTCKRA